jgi:hypothetical protein
MSPQVTASFAMADATSQSPPVLASVVMTVPASAPASSAASVVTLNEAQSQSPDSQALPESQDLAQMSPSQEEIAKLAATESGSAFKSGEAPASEHAAAGDLFDLIVESKTQLEMSDSIVPSSQPDLSLAPPPPPAIGAASVQGRK